MSFMLYSKGVWVRNRDKTRLEASGEIVQQVKICCLHHDRTVEGSRYLKISMGSVKCVMVV